MGTMEIGAAPVAWADEIALGRGLLREVGATAPPRDIGQEAALGQPILVHLDLLLTQPLGISLKAAFDLRFGLADLALDVIRLLVFPLGEVLLDDLHRALAVVGKILAVGLVGHVVVGPVVEGIGIVLHHHRVGVDAVALADADDLAVEGHLIFGLGHVVFSLLYWRGIAAAVTAIYQKKGRLRCHKRPKSREETPKVGSDSASEGEDWGSLPHTLSKMIAISGSIGRR